MSDTLQAIGRALSADIEGINAISHNVANISTPGFRAVRSVPDFANAMAPQNVIQMSDGPLAQTGRAYDLALRGPGFFAVDQEGQRLLVRSGNFHRSSAGHLVNAHGYPALSESGPLEIPEGRLSVDGTGEVSVDGRVIGRLQIVDVARPDQLSPVPGGYRYDGEIRAFSGHVEQGAVEQSNVDAAEQTLHLIELTRHAESIQRAFSIYDKVMDVGINHIGEN